VPPLCNRPDDIGRITKYLLALAADEGLPSMRIERKALGHLEGYHWPGGFSELENLIRRLTRLYPQKSITSQLVEQELSHKAQSRGVEETAAQSSSTLRELVERHLAAVFKECAPRLPAPGLYHRVLRELELPLIAAALSATRGNQIKAAKLLGVNRNTLRRKVREFDGVTIRLTR
jgi:two-component system nitrogen regulation response regulator GlnG